MKQKRYDMPILVVGSGEFIPPSILRALFESEDIVHEKEEEIPSQELRYMQQYHIDQLAYA